MEKKEKNRLLIVACLLIVVVIGIVVSVFGEMKTSSVVIDVKEEIPLPISIVLECDQETIVLYESDSIASTTKQFPSYSDVTEGVIWLTIGDEKHEILSYIDPADRPIIQIAGDGTSLEVLAYTTLFQTNKSASQSSTITISE